MGARRRSREVALQALYQMEMSGRKPVESLEVLCRHFEVSDRAEGYARELVEGIAGKWDEINDRIRRCAANWRLERMTVIDRNIIRLAVYELCCRDDVPPRVAINEAVELAKKYGTGESGAFINGVIDAVNRAGGGRAGDAPEDDAPEDDGREAAGG